MIAGKHGADCSMAAPCRTYDIWLTKRIYDIFDFRFSTLDLVRQIR